MPETSLHSTFPSEQKRYFLHWLMLSHSYGTTLKPKKFYASLQNEAYPGISSIQANSTPGDSGSAVFLQQEFSHNSGNIQQSFFIGHIVRGDPSLGWTAKIDSRESYNLCLHAKTCQDIGKCTSSELVNFLDLYSILPKKIQAYLKL